MDDRHVTVPGARDVADVLADDPAFALLGMRLANPVVLGIVLAILAVLVVVLGPSSDSHFIYTDF